MPYTEFKRRVIELDDEQLDVDQLERLIHHMPNPEQMNKLSDLKNDYDTLTEAEQFGVVVRNALLLNSLLTLQCKHAANQHVSFSSAE